MNESMNERQKKVEVFFRDHCTWMRIWFTILRTQQVLDNQN